MDRYRKCVWKSYFFFFFPFPNFKKKIALFEKTGSVRREYPVNLTKKRWPEEVEKFAKKYTEAHPCFFLEELQDELKKEFPSLTNISIPTICRALRHDLGLSRKVLTKKAREIRPQEISDFE